MDWNTFWTVVGLLVALSGAFIIDKLFPTLTAKAMKQPVENYVPDHIDRLGNIVMRKKN